MALDFTHKLDRESVLLLCAAVAAGSLLNRRNWCHPQDLKLPDGTPDPRAGRIDPRRVWWHVVAAFSFLFLGAICLGGGLGTLLVLIGLYVLSFFGPDMIWEYGRKLLDGLLPIIPDWIKGWLPGGKR